MPHVSMAVLDRTVPDALVDFVDDFLGQVDFKRVESRSGRTIEDLVPQNRHRGCAAFLDDLRFLTKLIDGFVDDARLQWKLESSTKTYCERFHVDRIKLRLICIYAGAGTEWLDDDDVDRSKLGPGSGGLDDQKSGLIQPNASLHRLDRFSVALMKGSLWSGCRGVVHRSPPTENHRRVLFRIDCF